jgi:hypothetical protein
MRITQIKDYNLGKGKLGVIYALITFTCAINFMVNITYNELIYFRLKNALKYFYLMRISTFVGMISGLSFKK